MKKIIASAFVAVLGAAALSSCCGKGECATGAFVNDSTLSKATVDSVSTAQGIYIGEAVLSNYPMLHQQEPGVSKEDIIKGVQTVFGAANNRGTQIGIQFGLQMLNEMKQLEDMGINVDRSLMLANFKRAFLQDSISQDDAQRAYAAYQGLLNRVQAEKRAREEARIAASPEAVNNVAEGAEYVAAVKRADGEVKTTDSGLSYKIINAGDGNEVKGAKRLKLKYAEKKIDGTVISETDENGRTAYLNTLAPGFSEGLKMLSKGGHAVFYVPGEIAYGVNGLPSRNVGPNEMVIYEVEVLDVE